MVMLSPLENLGNGSLGNVVWLFAIILFSSLPLYFAVKFLGGKTGLLKVFLVNLIVAFVVPIAAGYIGFLSSVIAFILMLVVYVFAFKIGFIRALLAWLLQFVFIVLFIFILGIFGITILGLSTFF